MLLKIGNVGVLGIVFNIVTLHYSLIEKNISEHKKSLNTMYFEHKRGKDLEKLF